MGGDELEGGAGKLILSKTVKKMCHEHPYAVGVHRLLHAQRTAGKVALQTILRDAVEQTHFLHDLMILASIGGCVFAALVFGTGRAWKWLKWLLNQSSS
jgi:hypothetical protein